MGQGASCLGRPYTVDDAVPTVCAKPLHNVQEEQVFPERDSAEMHEGRQHQRQQEAKAPVQAEGGSEQKVDGLERCDSAYLPRVQPLTDMAPISDDSSRSLTVQGLPYETVNLGPPKPPCNDERIATVHALNPADAGPDPQIEAIVQLGCTVFGTNNALVALLDQDRVIIRSGCGMFAPGDFPWRYSFCGYTLSPASPTTMVIEDSLQDARFRHNPFVNGNPPVRFYCGTPLVASNGHRLGTLCFADPEPHAFDAERCSILNNMAELCAREIERHSALRAAAQRSLQVDEVRAGMKRALEAFQEAIMMVDCGAQPWRVLHVNSAFTSHFDVDREAVMREPFWEQFALRGCAPGDDGLPAGLAETAAANKEFTLHSVFVRREEGTPALASHASSGTPPARAFTMGFRPAGTDQLESGIGIGVPSYLPSSPASGRGLYFVSVRPADTPSAASMIDSAASFGYCSGSREPPFQGLEVGALLGRGGYGSVYRGVYQGQRCAVKIVEDLSRVAMRDGMPLEATITEGIAHANIVNTLAHTVVLPEAPEQEPVMHDSAGSSWNSSGSGGPSNNGSTACSSSKQHRGASSCGEGEGIAWLLLEFCDKGCLQEAIDKGWFRAERTLTSGNGAPNLATILATAAQIADGMRFLHSRNVVHGDLAGGNILLTSDEAAPHGFAAKVADFGLARQLDIRSRVETRTYGTVTHMSHELLCSGIMSKAADVYAFGVLLWEMLAGCRAWASMKHAQIMHVIVLEKRMLKFPGWTPKPYAELALQCLSHDPAQRPSFEEAAAKIARLQETLSA